MSTATPPAAEPTPSAATPPTPTNPTGTPPAATEPEPTPSDPPDKDAEIAKWKAMSRKHEEQAKANADAKRRLDEIEEANKTELQKAADRAAAAEKLATDRAAETAVLKAAVKYRLDEDDLELLGTHGTPEEIDARAEKLAARLATPGTHPTPPADFGGGNRGGDVTGKTQLTREQLKDMKPEDIEQARLDGRLDTVLGIKTKT